MVTKSSSKANASARQKQTVIVHVGDTSKKRKPRRKRAAKPRGQAPPPSFGPIIRIPPTVIMQPSAPPLAPMGAPQQAQQILEQPAVNVPGFAKPIEDNKPLHKQVAEMETQTPKKQGTKELRGMLESGVELTPAQEKQLARADRAKQTARNRAYIAANPEEHVAAKQQLKSLAEQATAAIPQRSVSVMPGRPIQREEPEATGGGRIIHTGIKHKIVPKNYNLAV